MGSGYRPDIGEQSGVLAGLSDKDVTAGAVGAGSAPLIGRAIAKTMYGSDDPEKLSDEQKNELSQLTSVAGGLLGMVTSKGGAVDAATAAVAAKNEVENNYLRADRVLAFDKEMSACHKSGKDCSSIIGRYRKISNRQSAALKKKLSTEPLVVQSIDKELVQGGYDVTDAPAWANDIFGLDALRDEQAKAFVRSWNSQDLASIDKNSPTWSKFAAFASEPENMFALASTGFAIKDLVPTATSLIRRDLVSGTVDAAKIGMQWGKGVAKQGMPWENFFETIFAQRCAPATKFQNI